MIEYYCVYVYFCCIWGYVFLLIIIGVVLIVSYVVGGGGRNWLFQAGDVFSMCNYCRLDIF